MITESFLENFLSTQPKTTQMKKTVLNTRISENLKSELDYLSEIKGKNISEIVRAALSDFIEKSNLEEDTPVIYREYDIDIIDNNNTSSEANY